MLHNAFAISDVVTDVIIITLPLPMVGHCFRIKLEYINSHAIGLAAASDDSTKIGRLCNLRPRSLVSHLCPGWKLGPNMTKHRGCFNRKNGNFHTGNLR